VQGTSGERERIGEKQLSNTFHRFTSAMQSKRIFQAAMKTPLDNNYRLG
jgi:hypothetical protein